MRSHGDTAVVQGPDFSLLPHPQHVVHTIGPAGVVTQRDPENGNRLVDIKPLGFFQQNPIEYVWLDFNHLKTGKAEWGTTDKNIGRRATTMDVTVRAATFDVTWTRFFVTVDQRGNRLADFRTDNLSDPMRTQGVGLRSNIHGWRVTTPFGGLMDSGMFQMYGLIKTKEKLELMHRAIMPLVWLRFDIGPEFSLIGVHLDRQDVTVKEDTSEGPERWRLLVSYGSQQLVGNFLVHKELQRTVLDVWRGSGAVSVARPEIATVHIDVLPIEDLRRREPVAPSTPMTPEGRRPMAPPTTPASAGPQEPGGPAGARLPFVVNSFYRGGVQ